VAGVWH